MEISFARGLRARKEPGKLMMSGSQNKIVEKRLDGGLAYRGRPAETEQRRIFLALA